MATVPVWRDVYNLPRTIFSKVSPSERDLYFSFVASRLVGIQFKSYHDASQKIPFVVHVHGATNVPTAWFLKLIYPQIPIIYTMHDYNREPTVSYDISKILPYTKHSFKHPFRARILTLCSTGKSRKIRVITVKHRSRYINSAEFAYCADALTTVSKGMIIAITHSSEAYARLITTFRARGRLTNVNNWIGTKAWSLARSVVSSDAPAAGKISAKNFLFNNLEHFRHGNKLSIFGSRCVILWIGRFEENKGIHILPYIHTTACCTNCTLVISGYGSSKRARRLFTSVQETLNANAWRLSCPYLAVTSLQEQAQFNTNIRAAADIVVIPSVSEAYGLVAAEALAYGSIPVVSAVGGLPEIIKPYSEPVFASSSSDIWNWTGFTFESFGTNWDLTGMSMQTSLKQAINMLALAEQRGLTEAVQRNLIRSSPTGKTGFNIGVKGYGRIIDQLIHN